MTTTSKKRPALPQTDYYKMQAQIKRMRKGPRRYANRAKIAALYWLGLRTVELCDALVADFDLERGVYYPRARAKNGDPQPIAIHGECLAALIEYQAHRPGSVYMFPIQQGPRAGAKASPATVQKTWRQVRDAAGVSDRYTAHSARHGAAQLRKDRGWDLEEIRRFLGHRNLATTQRYLEGVGVDALHEMTARL